MPNTLVTKVLSCHSAKGQIRGIYFGLKYSGSRFWIARGSYLFFDNSALQRRIGILRFLIPDAARARIISEDFFPGEVFVDVLFIRLFFIVAVGVICRFIQPFGLPAHLDSIAAAAIGLGIVI